jgi:hypothetical protein
LHPGKNLNDLQSVVLHKTDDSPSDTLSSSAGFKCVPLLGWCREVLLESVTDCLLEIHPNLLESCFDYDDISWQPTHKPPHVKCRKIRIYSWTEYLNCPSLEVTYNEAVRITASSCSVRTATAPTPFGSKILSPGKTVLIPYRAAAF